MACKPYKGHRATNPMVEFLFRTHEPDQVVADALGVSQSSVFNWRTGVHSPRLDDFVALASHKGFEVVIKRRV